MENLRPDARRLKEIDKIVALDIAGLAGLPSRSSQGIIHSDIWTMHEDHKSIGQLMSAADVRKLLQQNIDLHIEAQKELLKKTEEHTVLVKWILEITKAWETEYSDAMQINFDIAQQILSAMQEAVFEIDKILQSSEISPYYIRQRILQSPKPQSNLPVDSAVVRFYFRNPYTSQIFTRLAGKILQKKEVCNKQGAYSSKIQRHDITIEKDQAIQAALNIFMIDDDRVLKCRELIDSDLFFFWIVDHKQDTLSRELKKQT